MYLPPVNRPNELPRQSLERGIVRHAAVFALLACGVLGSIAVMPSTASAGYYSRHRQYYSTWSYRPSSSYHYCRYYYSSAPTIYSYNYHYVIYYPTRPRFRYYYNPVRRTYWGRYEVDENGKAVGYSILAEKDRKASLDEIPESAFPKASQMPPIPEAKDKVAMLEPPAAPDKDSPSGKPGAYEKAFPNGPDADKPE